MTVIRGFSITVTSGIVFSTFGMLGGMELGKVAPDYYRSMLHIPPEVDFDPVQVGMGLGSTQGLIAGLVVGLIIVLTVAWFDVRSKDWNKS